MNLYRFAALCVAELLHHRANETSIEVYCACANGLAPAVDVAIRDLNGKPTLIIYTKPD